MSQRFLPKDVPDLARLAQLLAFTLSDDGCLDGELRDDLSCLAACLDEVLPSTASGRPRPRPGGAVVHAIRELLDYLLVDEKEHFAQSPSPGHIYRQLLLLDRWLSGVEGTESLRLDSEYGVPFISVSQPTDNNPAGRMMRRTLANMASFYTEQQSLDVREGLERRIREGWFVGKAPHGYRNVRKNGRGIVEIDPEAGPNVRRIFELFAYHNLTLDSLAAKLTEENRVFRPNSPKFPRSSLHAILRDRDYIGEIEFRGQWYPGKHEPLTDRATWDRVQALLGGHVYQSHELTYAGERIVCGHCGHPITGEKKTKRTKTGERHYVYYRCTYYNVADHPRTRVTEAELDRQVLAVFDKMRIEDAAVREWLRAVLRSQTKDAQADSLAQRAELQRQITLAVNQQNRLVDLRIGDEIDADVFAAKQTELRDRIASLKLQLDVVDRSHDEMSELAVKVF